MQEIKLSIIIITLNEQDLIRDCLESVSWADEIIVVDSGSNDSTLEICREYTKHILINKDWQGFGYQKNLALQQATGDWVFSIDADERVTSDLKQKIQQAIKTGSYIAYEMPRLAYFLGKEMRHGGWWPDYVLRLFLREKSQFSNDIVHERVLVKGTVGRINSHLIHHSYTSLEQVLVKNDKYSTAAAIKAHAQGKQSSLGKALIRAGWTFLRTYIFRLGFLDGKEGFIAALSRTEETYYRQLKLSYMSKE
ncbi:MAG: glycosyltransferase [Methyloprofundus sp.]|nr:glycosyltransferase [Methyloprofundus sp.]